MLPSRGEPAPMRPLVSIVIPTYNRAPDLLRALRSVLTQSHPEWEALIVDNQSSDNTAEVVRGFADSRMRFLRINNEGVIAASRNLGIKAAQGQYIAFLDSDDWWAPAKLERSVTRLEQGADVVYHDLYIVTKVGQRFMWKRVRTRQVCPPIFDDLICGGNALCNSSVVVRRELLTAIGGLSEDRDLIGVEDYDAWLRIAKLTDKFARINGTLGYYWFGCGNISNPNRTLSNISAIEDRYLPAIERAKGDGPASWVVYAKGRAYYRLASYASARMCLEQVRWSESTWLIWLKSWWMRLAIALCHS